jgi:hypothetical protein
MLRFGALPRGRRTRQQLSACHRADNTVNRQVHGPLKSLDRGLSPPPEAPIEWSRREAECTKMTL